MDFARGKGPRWIRARHVVVFLYRDVSQAASSMAFIYFCVLCGFLARARQSVCSMSSFHEGIEECQGIPWDARGDFVSLVGQLRMRVA